jgi:two-component system, LytTR family, sensor kinase
MKRIAVILLQAAYWAMYVLLSLFIIWASLNFNSPARHHFWRLVWHAPALIASIVPAVSGFYIFYTVLFSRFLKRKRLLLLLVSAVGVSLCLAIGTLFLISVLFSRRLDLPVTWDSAMEIAVIGLIAFVNGVLGLVMKGFISWYSDIRLKEELNRKNFEMELALIKSQISPHFLFNTLNNIDVLIEKDPILASGYLNKLSDILRFMLYETKTAQIPIGKELGYIEKYIALQRIRVSNPDAIRFLVEGQTGRLMVEPMLFMPFIENAFKHAEKKSDNAILIRFVLGAGTIVFACENKYNPNIPVRPDSDRGRDSDGGLGDSLIRRRLSLLYPGRHTLETDAGEELYKTKLTLTAHAN